MIDQRCHDLSHMKPGFGSEYALTMPTNKFQIRHVRDQRSEGDIWDILLDHQIPKHPTYLQGKICIKWN